MVFFYLAILAAFILIASTIYYGSAFLRLKFYLYLKKIENGSNLNQIQTLITSCKKTAIKLPPTIIKGIICQKLNYTSYLKLLSYYGKSLQVQLAHCNIFCANDILLLMFGQNLYLLSFGSLQKGRIVIDGKFKTCEHTINKSTLYYEKCGKIYSVTIELKDNALNICGINIMLCGIKMNQTHNGYTLQCSGIYNYFSKLPDFLINQHKIITLFDSIAKCALYSKNVAFESIVFDKIYKMPIENHFTKSYKIFTNDILFQATAHIISSFNKFGFNILYHYKGKEQVRILSKNTIIATGNLTTSSAQYIFKKSLTTQEVFGFNDGDMTAAYKILSKYYFYQIQKSQNYTDSFMLMLLSVTAPEQVAENLLFRAIKNQTIDGKIINFSNIKYSIINNYDCATLLFPICLNLYLSRTKNSDFLHKKLKYAQIAALKKETLGAFGTSRRMHLFDTVYEHAVKCLDILEFENGSPKVSGKTNLLGIKLDGKNKHSLTLIYLLSIKHLSGYFEASHYKKYAEFSKTLIKQVKDAVCKTQAINHQTSQLLFDALLEGVFCEKQFVSTYNFNSLYEFFEHFSSQTKNQKTLPTQVIFIYILGCLFEENFNSVYAIVKELCAILHLSGGKVLNQLVFDGTTFSFNGQQNDYFTVLLYVVMNRCLTGVRVDDKLIYLNCQDFLHGKQIDINGAQSITKVFFTKSGKNKVNCQGVSVLNQSAIRRQDVNVNINVEF